MHLYLATDLRPAAEDGRLGPDEDERLLVERVPWREALADAERGEIVDAKSLVGLFWLARLRGEPAIEDAAGAVAADAADRPTCRRGVPGAAGAAGVAADGDRVAVTYQLSRHEYAMATVVVSRRSRFLLVMSLVWLGLGAFSWVNGDVVLGVVAVTLGLAFVTGVFAYPFVWLQVRRRRDLFEAPHSFTADANGTTHTTPLGGSVQAWPVFRRADRHRGLRAVRHGRRLQHVRPGPGLHPVRAGDPVPPPRPRRPDQGREALAAAGVLLGPRFGCRSQPRQRVAVERRPGAQRHGQAEMRPRLARAGPGA